MFGNLTPYLMVLGIAALFVLPFLLFTIGKRFTGWHMLGFAGAMFGIIIVVNIFMAFKAVGTFPGLEVPNSYIASQSFERERAAQQALGWTVTPAYDGQELTLQIVDEAGLPARVASLSATLGRPTHVREDVTPDFTYDNGVFRAPLHLASGVWIIHVTATAPDGTEFRQRIDHYAGDRVN
ncbi:MAG: FixH family protein [Paracoccus sp. (in: a-proteobacteria)]|uniref:FixH family protein n=1 Tax=Paracoccus sp. TaxID=267 RepID=UPI0026DFEBD8|nr:FixH family protein [Paracoccus sp. (in: a-proteobacteria)]MDO5612073.1 FixH family protein [Paracoccus sp. (in: a-proteobacteria)]